MEPDVRSHQGTFPLSAAVEMSPPICTVNSCLSDLLYHLVMQKMVFLQIIHLMHFPEP